MGRTVAELRGNTGSLQGYKELIQRNHHSFSSFAEEGRVLRS